MSHETAVDRINSVDNANTSSSQERSRLHQGGNINAKAVTVEVFINILHEYGLFARETRTLK